jgi:two-component system nitrogen regulation sensor histidine kinase GlnL
VDYTTNGLEYSIPLCYHYGMPDVKQHIRDLTADILDGITDSVVVTDGSGVVQLWNRPAEEMTGVTATDAVGRSVGEVFADNPAVVSQIEKTLASGRSYSDYDTILAMKHRQPLAVGVVTSVLADRDGNALGVILTVRDQTGVRDLKERMRRADRLASIGQIAAGIAHEIKNPLVGIRGAAQLMQADLASPAGTNPAEYLDIILKEADRLNGVLEGILDFTRLKPLTSERFNVHAMLDRALLLQEESARQNGVVLAREYDPSLPDVTGNLDQLLQVFLNLVKNAIEAMPKGGKLTVVTRMSDLFTSVQADGKKHRLMVARVMDTGSGIKQEHLQDIFAPFFTTKDKGVGLGLALSYQIVQEHLGTIRIESAEGAGTTFSVYLPLAT